MVERAGALVDQLLQCLECRSDTDLRHAAEAGCGCSLARLLRSGRSPQASGGAQHGAVHGRARSCSSRRAPRSREHCRRRASTTAVRGSCPGSPGSRPQEGQPARLRQRAGERSILREQMPRKVLVDRSPQLARHQAPTRSSSSLYPAARMWSPLMSSASRTAAMFSYSPLRSESSSAIASSSTKLPSLETSSRWMRTFRQSSSRRDFSTETRMPGAAARASLSS